MRTSFVYPYMVWFLAGVMLTLPWLAYWVQIQNEFYGWARRSYFAWAWGGGWRFLVWFVLLEGLIVLATTGFALSLWSIAKLGELAGVTLALSYIHFIGAGFGCMIISGGAIGRWKQRRFLHLMELESPRCQECGYPLQGLRPRGSSIRCPECGRSESVRSIAKRFEMDRGRAAMDREYPV